MIYLDTSASLKTVFDEPPSPAIRQYMEALDAIHLATALQIRGDLDVLLTYDQRMLAAAAAHGLPTACPA